MDRTQEFVEAVKKCDIGELKLLLAHDITLVYAKSEEVISAFMLSLYYRHNEVTKLLLSYGLTLDIYEASAYGDSGRVAELLRDKPASLNEYSSDGWTALHLAAYFGNRKTVELLLDLDASALLHSKNPLQVTALHSALSNYQWDIALLLIKKGADIRAKGDGLSLTPLHYAAANGGFEVAKFLVSLGVDTSAETKDGKTPLQLAEEKGHTEIVKFLKQQGVN